MNVKVKVSELYVYCFVKTSILYGLLAWYEILNDWYHMYKTLGYINVPIIAYRPKDPLSIGSWCEVFTWNQGQEKKNKCNQ